MDSRREFLRKSLLLSGAAGLTNILPASIQKALAIDPPAGSTYLDAEHIVILMQENRSFDHCFGSLQGVRGFNDPRALRLPNDNPVWFQTDAAGDTYAPFRFDIKDTKVTWMGSLPHSRASQVDANNAGKYDQWLLAKQSGNKKYAAMPLTLGHYTRQDLPFTYAMADAFTVCDQNFCSAMTSTTPNRSFFWTGKITEMENGITKANIRNDNFSFGKMQWQTFPELLEKNGIKWKFYQNELSCGGGFSGEERSWLANFGCNLLEFFKVYNVKFAPKYIQSLQKQVDTLPGEIGKLQEESPSSDDAADKIKTAVKKKQEVLDNAQAELLKWNTQNFEKLSAEEKSLFFSAFTVNSGDPDYRSLVELSYTDTSGGKERKLNVPKGDILHQFREDVKTGKLPTVSWLAGPQNFSDHPSAPWYGAWYVSEILDILTQNPEVWKKTIFIVTYDENDGYFDHVPPFAIPDNNKPGTGKVSAGIETEMEHVRLENELKQGIPKKQAREAPIGLGFRVPMVIASPWSRGGKVCSEVFDHTSSLQFLETFVNKKYKKNIHLDNISEWRRTICGDLTSAFTPFNGSKLGKIPFLNRNHFVEDIYNAKFKEEPTGYKKITEKDIEKFKINPATMGIMSQQERGVRPSSALPYQLYTNGKLNTAKSSFEISFNASNELFKAAAGSPFTVYAPGQYKDAENDNAADTARNWAFAVKAGDTITYNWPLSAFDNAQYFLRLYGPNGFYREYKGSASDAVQVVCDYERKNGLATGNVELKVTNNSNAEKTISVLDFGKTKNDVTTKIAAGKTASIVLNLNSAYNWYDFSIKVTGDAAYEHRFAGRVETGKESFSDPVMGRV
ncbi:MAG: phospholipase C, phosphocholine-specific [Filimonas sp.]|nr:phospholipase C, phosphocholine-specific [Filimonas sp.]